MISTEINLIVHNLMYEENNTAQSITAHPLDSDLSILSIMQYISIREVSEVSTTSDPSRFYFLPTPFYGPLRSTRQNVGTLAVAASSYVPGNIDVLASQFCSRKLFYNTTYDHDLVKNRVSCNFGVRIVPLSVI